jgi:hypothetical protein
MKMVFCGIPLSGTGLFPLENQFSGTGKKMIPSSSVCDQDCRGNKSTFLHPSQGASCIFRGVEER